MSKTKKVQYTVVQYGVPGFTSDSLLIAEAYKNLCPGAKVVPSYKGGKK